MWFLRMLGIVVYAAESIISPIPDDVVVTYPKVTHVVSQPQQSFASLYEIAMRQSKVLGQTTEQEKETVSPSPSPSLTPLVRKSLKPHYTIAMIGDSMVDTLGPDLGGLDAKLAARYPKSTFSVINHGVGATNIEYGYDRLTRGYSYLGQTRESLVASKPDIVVIESFGYNPFPLPDMNDAINKHWLTLAKMVDVVREQLPEAKIVIAATIAPNWDTFGDGAAGLSYSPEGKRTKVIEIKKYIESAIKFAQSQHLPLADAYSSSLDRVGNGKLQFINGGDNIHYSEAGRSLMAQQITNAIVNGRLLE